MILLQPANHPIRLQMKISQVPSFQAAVPENLNLFLPVLRLCEYHISVKFYSLICLHIEDLIPEVSRLVHGNSSG